VELGQWRMDDGPVTHEGAAIPFTKLNSWYLPARSRARLRKSHRNLPEQWFRYEKTLLRRGDTRFYRAVDSLLQVLPQALAWFEGERPQANVQELMREAPGATTPLEG
jgi:hypothetical protein